MNATVVLQARIGSTRLPGKVMKPVFGSMSLIECLLSRLEQCKKIDGIIVAIPEGKKNQPLGEHVQQLGYQVHRGSENDVLSRYVDAALSFSVPPENIVRITADCPFIAPELVDDTVSLHNDTSADYTSNIEPPTFPDGLDVEVIKFNVLREINTFDLISHDREHVTSFIRGSDTFKKANLNNSKDLSEFRWTVDTETDLDYVKRVLKYFNGRANFCWTELVELSERAPERFLHKSDERNIGMLKSNSEKVRERAKKRIPGGNSLLSKRAEMFLPDGWPTYFLEASGCRVTDIDGNTYIDMSTMGVGTNLLGYANENVDAKVKEAIQKSNMSTLNCVEEVELAEKLVEMHPWSDMVKFARTGGEANSIAVRIARARSGKDKIAICGYHGWHDWYLAANLAGQENLDGHLLPGLNTAGVPKGLRGTILPFTYGDYENIEKIFKDNDLSAVKMEVCRSQKPDIPFLKKIRALCTENDVALIFDECTSGFRECYGGLHMKYGIYPDIAIFGKALGNGYAITSVIGKKEWMDVAQDTFISSTFWTERIGPTAALATLSEMRKQKSWETVTKLGEQLRAGWQSIAEGENLPVMINGIPSLSSFNIPSVNWLKYKTLICQEMLKNGFLASNQVYLSTAHSADIIEQYLAQFTLIVKKIKKCENGELGIEELLDGRICHSGFTRLN